MRQKHEAWLPILHTSREERHYIALFSNTARAHELGKTRDWVVLFCDGGVRENRYTVITSQFGPSSGQRIVPGHEAYCEEYYKRPKASELCETTSKGQSVPPYPCVCRASSLADLS